VNKKEPVWVTERDVTAIHDRLLALHGGAAGLRDRGLLQSALARPCQHHTYSARVDLVELSAIYVSGIVRNHPFLDGNKRSGFVAGVLFLEINGFQFVASEADATQAVLSLASGTLDEEGFRVWLQQNIKPKR
jgi:death-on-curing protein